MGTFEARMADEFALAPVCKTAMESAPVTVPSPVVVTDEIDVWIPYGNIIDTFSFWLATATSPKAVLGMLLILASTFVGWEASDGDGAKRKAATRKIFKGPPLPIDET